MICSLVRRPTRAKIIVKEEGKLFCSINMGLENVQDYMMETGNEDGWDLILQYAIDRVKPQD